MLVCIFCRILRGKKHLKRWPACLMRFLLLTSPDIPLPFQRGIKMNKMYDSMPRPGLPRAVRCVSMSKSTVDQFRQCKGTTNEKSAKK